MGEPDPRLKKVRKTGVGVFVVVAVATIPIAIHIIRTRESPEIWLTLLGAVLMLVLICLYALETALSPIPKPRTVTPPSVDPDADTILDEPADGGEATEGTEAIDPQNEAELSPPNEATELQSGPSLTPEFDSHEPLVQEGASLVEAEEVLTHPPFDSDVTGTEHEHSTNPDGPMLTMPSPALDKANPDADDDELTDSIVDEATE
jgi:hypothetical protein